MSRLPTRHRFSVERYLAMASHGFLEHEDRLELVDGDIVEMTPSGSRHAACVEYLSRSFHERMGERVIVSVHGPIEIDENSLPKPDVTVLRAREDGYLRSHPMAADVRLLVEVSETSLDYDRSVKVPLYARSGVVEVWIVNLPKNRLEVYCRPSEEGYTITRMIERDEIGKPSLSPQALPDVVVDVNAVLA